MPKSQQQQYYDALIDGTGLVGLFSGDQLHPPMVDEEAFWLDPKRWREGVLAATRQLVQPAQWPAGSKILDIGCGVGGVAVQLNEEMGLQVLGINNSAGQIEVARKLNQLKELDNKFQTADAQSFFDDLQLKAHSFDGAVSVNMAYHLKDRTAMFEQIAKAVKPNGMLALDDWVVTEKITASELNKLNYNWSVNEGSSLATFETYERELKEAGWEILKVQKLGYIGRKYTLNEQMYQRFKSIYLQDAIRLYKEYGEATIDTMIEDLKFNGMLYAEGKMDYFQLIARYK